MSKSQPWAERNRMTAALRNKHVRVENRDSVGRALFAARAFSVGDYVASYQGRTITRADFFALHGSDRPLFERITEYGVQTPSGGHLYPETMDAPGAHLINHSCGPNAEWAEYGHGAMLVRAVRPIAEDEEITIHYGWVGIKAAIEKNWHRCACAAPYCVGTIELRVEWLQENETDEGPFLSEEEITKRLFADIVNDTDEHERLLFRYASGSTAMTPGAHVVSALDPDAFLDKVRECANAAIGAAIRCRELGKNVSRRRLRQIADVYSVSIRADE